MTDKMAGKNRMDRRGCGKDAQTAGVAMPVTGFGRSFYRRLMGAILALSLMFNSVSFAVDGYSPRRALSEEGIYAETVDPEVLEQDADLDDGGAELFEADEAQTVLEWDLAVERTALLSGIFARYGLPVDARAVEDVLLPGGEDAEETSELVSV